MHDINYCLLTIHFEKIPSAIIRPTIKDPLFSMYSFIALLLDFLKICLLSKYNYDSLLALTI